MLRGAGSLIFIFASLIIGIECTFYPNQVIHFVFGRTSESQRKKDQQVIPGIKSHSTEFYEFLKLAEQDPDLIGNQFPEYTHTIRGIGLVSLLIFFICLCGLLTGAITF